MMPNKKLSLFYKLGNEITEMAIVENIQEHDLDALLDCAREVLQSQPHSAQVIASVLSDCVCSSDDCIQNSVQQNVFHDGLFPYSTLIKSVKNESISISIMLMESLAALLCEHGVDYQRLKTAHERRCP